LAGIAAGQTPDLILIRGKILTVDAKDSVVEAVAIAKGKIVAVGSSAEIQRRAGSTTRVVDLNGLTATPGLIDTHGHFAAGGVDEMFHVVLGDTQQVSDVLDKIREKTVTLKPGEWLVGTGWDEGKLAERRYLFASDLDKITPNNPVWLMHTTGHYGVANSYALKLAQITASTPDPPAGQHRPRRPRPPHRRVERSGEGPDGETDSSHCAGAMAARNLAHHRRIASGGYDRGEGRGHNTTQ